MLGQPAAAQLRAGAQGKQVVKLACQSRRRTLPGHHAQKPGRQSGQHPGPTVQARNSDEDLMQQLRVVISGCSGGGKSTLLAELARRGYGVVEEPGRRIIVNEGLRPEVDMEAFLRRCFALACVDFERVQPMGQPEPGPAPRLAPIAARRRMAELAPVPAPKHVQPTVPRPAPLAVFFDRSALDAQVGLARLRLAAPGGAPSYHPTVFLTPPWRETYARDAERRHSFETGVAEYHALLDGLPEYGYEVRVMPKLPVVARADYLLEALGL
jgi:predicted ATPase